MKECTNPQYVVRATDENFHTEIFSIEPGGYPAIVNEIPPGQPTIAPGSQEQMVQSIAKLLADNGHCKMPQTVATPAIQEVEQAPSEVSTSSGLGALAENAQPQIHEGVQGIPNVYQRRVSPDSIESTGGAEALVFGAVALAGVVAGGRVLVNQVQNRMFTDLEVQNHDSIQPEDNYTVAQPVAAVSAVPTPEPSPWARTAVHAGNPLQQAHFGRNDSPKWLRNDSEMTSKRAEMTPEMGFISPEMSLVDQEQINRVRQRLSGILRNAETVDTQAVSDSISPEMSPVSGYFFPSDDLTEAKRVYFQLRQQGIAKATDLGGAIFGIRGGDKWASVSPILHDWNLEWESTNG